MLVNLQPWKDEYCLKSGQQGGCCVQKMNILVYISLNVSVNADPIVSISKSFETKASTTHICYTQPSSIKA